jgi:5-methylcytosine-specific restriction endonuclease McrA
MKTQTQIENREDFLAKKEYGIAFEDLPPDIKQNVHNAVLEEMGLRMQFKFVCLECGQSFDNEVEGDMVDIYTEIQTETHTNHLQGLCPKCISLKNKQEEGAIRE